MVAVHYVYNSSKQEALFPAVFVNVGTNQTLVTFTCFTLKKELFLLSFDRYMALVLITFFFQSELKL